MAYGFTFASNQSLEASVSMAATPMTIVCWARLTNASTGSGQVIASVGVSGGLDRNQLFCTGGGQLGVACRGQLGQATPSGPTVINNDEWSHYCLVAVSSTSRFGYLNGSLEITNTTAIGTQASANNVVVGARWATTLGGYITGQVAEVGVWNTDLSADEIASLADGMTCDKVRPQSLVFYAPLCRNLIDVKGGLSITNNNSATVANHPRVYA